MNTYKEFKVLQQEAASFSSAAVNKFKNVIQVQLQQVVTQIRQQEGGVEINVSGIHY